MSESAGKRAFVSPRIRKYAIAVTALALLLFVGAWLIAADANARYERLLSEVMYDRNGTPVRIAENSKGHYAQELTTVPKEFETLLLKKEDRFFYFHPGVNPVSTVRAAYHYVTGGTTGGASTISQQLAKNLLGTETNRTLTNKLIETVYALSLELFTSKETMLLMYANSVYLGNQVQGFATASHAYFDKPLAQTTHSERLSLLAALSYPSTRNPWEAENAAYAAALHSRIAQQETFTAPKATDHYSFRRDASFELETAGVVCKKTCATTIDDQLTTDIRAILARHVADGRERGIRSGAIVVIDPKTGELLTFIGTPHPTADTAGSQVNMAIAPRPIGSTVKPLIYAKGFAAGLRPYTTVEDREYKYPIATGFSLYPKNYDGQYRGEVTLHEALSNSLNVPTVKVLEYIGLNNFYAFLSDDLAFQPIQDYDTYQYGIALGGLEMDLLTLTHYFTLFPRGGTLTPLTVLQQHNNNFDLPPQSHIDSERRVVEAPYTELVHAIISDRFTGVNQFGLTSNLSLTYPHYGVKTGTSRDFHDSWVVGYTGDFVVGVWLGNTENQPLQQVSGSSGAGAVWHDVMEYLLNTTYHLRTTLPNQHLQRLLMGTSDEWGLGDDVIAHHRDLLEGDTLILSPHGGDVFALTPNLTIPLEARKRSVWSVNGTEHSVAVETDFSPQAAGTYEIVARDSESDQREIITITVTAQE